MEHGCSTLIEVRCQALKRCHRFNLYTKTTAYLGGNLQGAGGQRRYRGGMRRLLSRCGLGPHGMAAIRKTFPAVMVWTVCTDDDQKQEWVHIHPRDIERVEFA